MRYITEFELWGRYRNNPSKTFHLPPSCRLTQAAEQFLNDRKIKVITGGGESSGAASTGKNSRPASGESGYLLPDGRVCREKPEHMTHLRGRNLVDKRHPRIRLRGKLDTLQAMIIDSIIDLETMGLKNMARYLEEILNLARGVMRAEVTGEEMPEPSFAGHDSITVRDMSHHPDNYFGVRHFLPSPDHGRAMSRLNILRTAVREAELAAAEAFCRDDGETGRRDIIETLNRMSSMVYIMMCRLLAGQYGVGRSRG